MSLAPAAVAKLLSVTAITALVANRVDPQYTREMDRVYPIIVYKVENVTPGMAHDGPTGLESAELVLACLGCTQKQADQLAAAVQTAMDGARGLWGTLNVQGCFLQDDGITMCGEHPNTEKQQTNNGENTAYLT